MAPFSRRPKKPAAATTTKKRMRLTIKARLVVSFALVTAVAVAAGGAIFFNVDRIHTAEDENTRATTLLATVADALQDVTAQEASMRGYLVSASVGKPDEIFLATYKSGATRFKDDMERAAKLADAARNVAPRSAVESRQPEPVSEV